MRVISGPQAMGGQGGRVTGWQGDGVAWSPCSLVTLSRCPGMRACQTPQCSLSTGRSLEPERCAAGMTSWPAATRVSLLARAISRPRVMAARVAGRPAAPTMAPRTMSHSTSRTRRSAAPWPRRMRAPGGGCGQPASSAMARSVTPRRAAWAQRASAFLPVARPTTRKRTGDSRRSARALRCSTTSTVWVPMEPVEPRMMRRFSITRVRAAGLVGRERKSAGFAAQGLRSSRACQSSRLMVLVTPGARRLRLP